MKRFLFLVAMIAATTTFAQFKDTADANKFVRDTIKDRRPDKVTAAQIQKALLGISGLTAKDSVKIKSIGTKSSSESPYEFIIYPDLQFMTAMYPDVLKTMFQWAKDSAAIQNVKAFIGVGDMSTYSSDGEFKLLDSQYKRLDSLNIPYITPPGNHDYGPTGNVHDDRDLTVYNTYFGVSRYAGKSWYAGTMPGSGNENSFYKFEVGSRKYMVVSLEFMPRDTAINWAGKIIGQNQDREVIITTHGYITVWGERGQDTSLYSPVTYSITGNTGQQLWDKLIKNYPNISLVVAGHFVDNSRATGFSQLITDVGVHGNVIHQIFVNYQNEPNGGNGYFMKLRFRPSDGEMDVSFYSTYLHTTDPHITGFELPMWNGYTLDYPTLSVNQTIGLDSSLYVRGETRFDGKVFFDRLIKNRVPFTGINGQIQTTPGLGWDPVTRTLSTPNLSLGGARFKYDSTTNTMTGATKMQIGSTTGTLTQLEGNLPPTVTAVHGGGNWGYVVARAANDNGTANYAFYKTRNSDVSIKTPLAPGDGIGRLSWQGVDSSSQVRRNAWFELDVDSMGAIGLSSTMHMFLNNYAFSPLEVMRWKWTGLVGMPHYGTGFFGVGYYQLSSLPVQNISIDNVGNFIERNVLNIPSSTPPTSSSDASGIDGDIRRDTLGNLYLKTGGTWYKFAGATF
jgi:hypothetical protein